jgi:hypothetical protein
MRSRPIGAGQSILASQADDRRDDSRAGSFLLPHQMLGTLALATLPSNGQVIPIVINGTTITLTAVSTIGSTPNNILIPGTAAAFAQNVTNFLRRPDLTNSNQVAAAAANQSLLQYVGWAWPGSSTNIVPFSLNKNVNGIAGSLTSFNITGITVTGGTWTAQTMKLYIQDGTYFINGVRYLFTGNSTPTVTAPVSNPRIDVLTIDSSGTLAWTTGTENASPVAPTYPSNKLSICELYNVVSETALYDNENQQPSQGYILNDVRPSVSSGVIFTSIASDLDPDANDTRQIGSSSSNEWLNIYGKNIYASGLLQLNGVNAAVSKFGGTGADGALSITSGTTTINCAGAAVVVKNYTSISITGTGKLAFSNPAAGGTIIILKSQGNVTITSSAGPAIDVRGMGASGGTGASSGGGTTPQQAYTAGGQGLAGGATSGSSHTNNTNLATSGNIFASWVDGISMGAAFPGNSTTSPNVGAINNANSALTAYHKYYVLPGGGGAGNEGGSTSVGGNGGIGGGGLYIECGGALNFTTAINAAGGAPTGTYLGGGGGGGSVQILYNTLTANSGTITVTGDSTNASAVGGNGLSYVGANTEFS